MMTISNIGDANIVKDPYISNDIDEALLDVINLLIKVDGDFAKRLQIDLIDQTKAPVYIRESKMSNQSFHIKYKQSSLTIYANYTDGFRNGLYYFLESLGYKFYFPGELWTIYPTAINKGLLLNKTICPDFKGVQFFGGGGYPRQHPADPDNYVMNSWELWKARNKFGQEYASQGHMWQTFISRHKDIIDKHPEYVSDSGRQLCVSNKNLQELFVLDRIKELENNIKKFGPNAPQSKGIGVEPNDGGDHCQCDGCKKLGSVSNRVYFLANLVAKKIQKKHPNVKVTLYAYNEHAAPPDFIMEPNVHVGVIPYAFQDVAAPEELIKMWSKKVNRLQVYDYWGVMIWTRGYPVKNFMKLAQERIKTWDDLGVDMIMVESTYGIANAGIPLYLLSKLAWNKELNSEKILYDFFIDCFGIKSGAIMQSILNRWSDNGIIPSFEAVLLPQEFEKALDLSKTKKQRLRIQNFIKYFEFILLQESVKNTKPSSNERDIKTRELIEYSYSIIKTMMIHSYWMPHPLSVLYNSENYSLADLRKAENNYPSEYWTRLSQKEYSIFGNNREASIERMIRESYETDLATSRSNKVPLPVDTPNNKRKFKTAESFTFKYQSDKKTVFVFDLSVKKNNLSYNKAATIVSIYEEGNIIFTKRFEPGNYSNEKLTLRTKGSYEIRVRSSNTIADFTWYNCKGIELEPGTNINFGEYYIFLNEYQKEIIINSKFPIQVFSGNKKLPIRESKGLKIIELDEPGKVIKVIAPEVVYVPNGLKTMLN